MLFRARRAGTEAEAADQPALQNQTLQAIRGQPLLSLRLSMPVPAQRSPVPGFAEGVRREVDDGDRLAADDETGQSAEQGFQALKPTALLHWYRAEAS